MYQLLCNPDALKYLVDPEIRLDQILVDREEQYAAIKSMDRNFGRVHIGLGVQKPLLEWMLNNGKVLAPDGSFVDFK